MERIPKDWRSLRNLAKENGIKANQKKDVIIAELLKKFDEEKSKTCDEYGAAPSPNHSGATDSSTPESNSSETSPESRNNDSPTKRVRFQLQNSARSVMKSLSRVFPKSPADGRKSKSSVVQDLNLRFDKSFKPRAQAEDDSSVDSKDSNDLDNVLDSRRGSQDDAGERNNVVIVDTEHDVVEIIDRMNRLSISVDIDGPNATSKERATDLPPLEELGFDFPAGGLGLYILKDEFDNTFVSEVKDDCPLRDYIIRGDVILSIDDVETRKMNLQDVKKIAARRSFGPRRVVFGRQAPKRKGKIHSFT